MPGEPLRFIGSHCELCDQLRPSEALDENGWCPDCQERLRRRVRIGRHVVALLIVLPFAIWIVWLDKTAFLPWYAWLLPAAAAYYLGLRIGNETMKGYASWRRLR